MFTCINTLLAPVLHGSHHTGTVRCSCPVSCAIVALVATHPRANAES